MTTFLEAREQVLSHVSPLPADEVSLLEAAGRVIAADMTTPFDFPRFDNSAMDGWAVRAADATAPAALPVTGYIPAGGTATASLAPGAAVRIMTGAPIPPGADTVVPLEEAEEREGTLHVSRTPRRGEHVRRRGQDIAAGDRIVPAGTVLGAPEVSILASASIDSVPVFRRPRVAILSTGDELVEPGAPLGPGQIHDSNAIAIAAAVTEAGGIPVRLGIARDELGPLRERLVQGLGADVLVTTAGVSMGDRDLVRQVLAELGVASVFFTLEVKPGHPTAFGTLGNTLVFSLPGNPVSTLIMFEQLVRPALLRMQGHRSLFRPLVPAVLDEKLPHRGGRVTFSRVKLESIDGILHARSAGKQETWFLRPLLEADGIAVLPPERADAPAGLRVPVQLLRRDGA